VSQVARGLLEARGRVQHITVERDGALALPDLPAHHEAAVQRGPHHRRHAEVVQEAPGVPSERVLQGEQAPQRPRVGALIGDRPRDHHLVADVLVDLAAVVRDRVRGGGEYTREEPVHRERPQALGDGRRTHDVDEQEQPRLGAQPVIPPEHDVEQGTSADEPPHREHEQERVRDDQRVADGQRKERDAAR